MDDFRIDFPNPTFNLDYQKVIADKGLSAITKETARLLMREPYLSVGNWFRRVSDSDLTFLNFLVEGAMSAGNKGLDDLIVLTEMLSRAEGVVEADETVASNNVNHFATLISVVSLHRRGLVEAIFENMSFGQDMMDAEIVRLG